MPMRKVDRAQQFGELNMTYQFPETLEESLLVRETAYQRLDTIQTDDAHFRVLPRIAESKQTDCFEVAFNDLTNYLVALNRHIRLLEIKKRAKKYAK
jgi:hypothetical protein